jgi:hypothetical protein
MTLKKKDGGTCSGNLQYKSCGRQLQFKIKRDTLLTVCMSRYLNIRPRMHVISGTQLH